jgi:putative thioredoxin
MSRNPFGELPKNLAQAVDLSSLGKPNTPLSEAGVAINQKNFIEEILPASNKSIVITLAWSPRSSQSKDVLAILDEFNKADSNGPNPWILATLNVDQEAGVAQALQIQSVPIVVAIVQEQLVPLFESVPPKDQVRMVIDKVISLAAERGIGNPVEKTEEVDAPMEPEEIAALDALEKNDLDGALMAYKNWLQRSPNNAMAQIGLAQVELMARIVGVIPNEVLAIAASQLDNLEIQMKAADVEVAQGNYESAFNRLISLVQRLDGEDQKAIRNHLLNLFKLVDPADPILIKSRQSLASALF